MALRRKPSLWHRMLAVEQLPLVLAALLLLLFTIAGNAYINHRYFATVFFDFDGAGEILLAKQVAQDGRFVYSGNWHYSTELRTIHNQLIMALLFRFIKNPFTVHLISTIVINLFMALAATVTLKLLRIPLWASILGGALAATPFSYDVFYINIANNFYSFFVLCTLLFVGVFLRLFITTQGRKWWAAAIALCFASLAFGLCGLRYLLILYAPLGLLLLALVVRRIDKKAFRPREPVMRAVLLFTACLAAYAIGFILYEKVLRPHFGVVNLTGLYAFSSRSDIAAKLLVLPETLLTLFAPLYGESLTSLSGFAELVGLMAVLAMAAACLYLVSIRRRLSHIQRYYIAFAWISFLFTAFVLLFTKDIYGGGSLISGRYMLIGMYPLITMPALALGNAVSSQKQGILPLGQRVLLGLAIAASLTSNTVSIRQVCANAGDPSGAKALAACVEYLQDNGYRYGFAQSSAGGVELLSGFEIQATGVIQRDGQFKPHNWLQSKSSYEVHYGEERQFLLLSHSAYQGEAAQQALAEKEIAFDSGLYYVIEVAPEDILPQ